MVVEWLLAYFQLKLMLVTACSPFDSSSMFQVLYYSPMEYRKVTGTPPIDARERDEEAKSKRGILYMARTKGTITTPISHEPFTRSRQAF
jgi:hypothetical protein